MANNPYQKYKSTQVETASQEKLLIMLYNGAIKFTKQAKTGIEEENYELVNNGLGRVQAIITELRTTLDQEKVGEIAQNMDALYENMNRRLIEANVEKDIKPIEEVLDMLIELKGTWQQAIEKVKSNNQSSKDGGVSIER